MGQPAKGKELRARSSDLASIRASPYRPAASKAAHKGLTHVSSRSLDHGDHEITCASGGIHTCLTNEVLFKLPLRQTTGMVDSLLEMADLDWTVPDYTTLCRRQKTLAVQIPYRRADGPLNLLVDSTGIKFLGDGALSWFEGKPLPGNKWQARKHGVQGRRQSLPPSHTCKHVLPGSGQRFACKP